MPKFDSGTDVEPLDYDLTAALVGTDLAEDEQRTGRVPEPSQDGIVEYMEAIGDIKLREREFARQLAEKRRERLAERFRETHDGKDPGESDTFTAGQLREVYAEDRGERDEFREEIRRDYIDAVAEACQGVPRRDLLEVLPERQLQAFAGWLMGMFSPEVVAAGIYG